MLKWLRADNSVVPLQYCNRKQAVTVLKLTFLDARHLVVSTSRRLTTVYRFDAETKTLTQTARLAGTYTDVHRPTRRIVLRIGCTVSLVKIDGRGKYVKSVVGDHFV